MSDVDSDYKFKWQAHASVSLGVVSISRMPSPPCGAATLLRKHPGLVVAASPTGTTAISPISIMPIFHPPITPQSTQPPPSLAPTHRAFSPLESSTVGVERLDIAAPQTSQNASRPSGERAAHRACAEPALVSRAWNEARREVGVWMSCSSSGSVRTCRFGGRIDSHESRGRGGSLNHDHHQARFSHGSIPGQGEAQAAGTNAPQVNR